MARTVDFRTPAPLDLRVSNAAGTITVTAADTDTSTVEVEAIGPSPEARELAERTVPTLSSSGDRLVVEVPERHGPFNLRPAPVSVRITVPTGSRVSARAASAEVGCTGRMETVTARTASGDVSIAEVTGDVKVQTASGSVRLASAGRVDVHTASGRVDVERATGDVDVRAASGDIHVGVAEASVRARTASGRVAVDDVRCGTVSLTAASGDLRVGVRAGVVARLDLRSASGRVRSELPVDDVAPEDGARLEIRARTASGDLLVTSAAGAGHPAGRG